MKQPLTAIAANGSAARALLGQTPPDIAEVRASLRDIVDDSHRTNGALDGIRALVRRFDQEQEPVDINTIALGVLQSLRASCAIMALRHGPA
ncbi:MAG TPA: hypothetical protein VK749_11830 [Xanthobacteraceae bacterium]|nr:hypothetical protein [Xanthobacteraceae bacterium]